VVKAKAPEAAAKTQEPNAVKAKASSRRT
jgi:hypothetical protein